jgi:hypothetical protein
VWRFGDDFERATPSVSLGVTDFGGLVPQRIALSPDATWLAVAFDRSKSKTPAGDANAAAPCTGDPTCLLVVAVDRGTQRWAQTGLRSVREIAFDTSGTLFAAGGDPGQQSPGSGVDEVQLWKVGADGFERSGERLVLSVPTRKVYELAFAVDEGKRPMLLVGGMNGMIDRWDVDHRRMLEPLQSGSRPVRLLAYSSGSSLVAAADLHNVRVVDAASKIMIPLTPLGGPLDDPGFLAFGGDGAWLASGGKALQLWDLDVGSLERRTCALLHDVGGRPFDGTVLRGDGGLCPAAAVAHPDARGGPAAADAP